MARLHAGWLALAMVGCAESADRRGPTTSDLEGVYQVSSWLEGACDTQLTEATPGFPYFEVEVRDVVNVESLALLPCDAPGDCSTGLDVVYFAEFDDFEAAGESTTTSFDGSRCTFVWEQVSLELDAGEVVFSTRVEEVTGVDGIDIDDCVEQHEAWTGSTPCVALEQVRGELAR